MFIKEFIKIYKDNYNHLYLPFQRLSKKNTGEFENKFMFLGNSIKSNSIRPDPNEEHHLQMLCLNVLTDGCMTSGGSLIQGHTHILWGNIFNLICGRLGLILLFYLSLQFEQHFTKVI
jgi:hypothetical protein